MAFVDISIFEANFNPFSGVKVNYGRQGHSGRYWVIWIRIIPWQFNPRILNEGNSSLLWSVGTSNAPSERVRPEIKLVNAVDWGGEPTPAVQTRVVSDDVRVVDDNRIIIVEKFAWVVGIEVDGASFNVDIPQRYFSQCCNLSQS